MHGSAVGVHRLDATRSAVSCGPRRSRARDNRARPARSRCLEEVRAGVADAHLHTSAGITPSSACPRPLPAEATRTEPVVGSQRFPTRSVSPTGGVRVEDRRLDALFARGIGTAIPSRLGPVQRPGVRCLPRRSSVRAAQRRVHRAGRRRSAFFGGGAPAGRVAHRSRGQVNWSLLVLVLLVLLPPCNFYAGLARGVAEEKGGPRWPKPVIARTTSSPPCLCGWLSRKKVTHPPADLEAASAEWHFRGVRRHRSGASRGAPPPTRSGAGETPRRRSSSSHAKSADSAEKIERLREDTTTPRHLRTSAAARFAPLGRGRGLRESPLTSRRASDALRGLFEELIVEYRRSPPHRRDRPTAGPQRASKTWPTVDDRWQPPRRSMNHRAGDFDEAPRGAQEHEDERPRRARARGRLPAFSQGHYD